MQERGFEKFGGGRRIRDNYWKNNYFLCVLGALSWKIIRTHNSKVAIHILPLIGHTAKVLFLVALGFHF